MVEVVPASRGPCQADGGKREVEAEEGSHPQSLKSCEMSSVNDEQEAELLPENIDMTGGGGGGGNWDGGGGGGGGNPMAIICG